MCLDTLLQASECRLSTGNTHMELRHGMPHQWYEEVKLKHKSQNIIFTDGSKKKCSERGAVTGSGVYREAEEAAMSLTVNPNRQGMLNTITRAELAAIFVAIEHGCNNQDETIATDSKCSMDKIAKHLQNPALTTNDCHQPMLQAIVTLLANRARAGLSTTLMKVKSHIGIKGSEMADQLANTAAQQVATEGQLDIDVSSKYLENFEHKYWPKQKVKHQAYNGETTELWQHVRDLKDSLMGAIHIKMRLGQSNQDSVWFKAWADVFEHTEPKYTNAFWEMPQITASMTTNLLKTRQGNLWTMKLAFQRNMAYMKGLPKASNDLCPLCHRPDSAGHMLGGCMNADMKALYIARHDKAMRHVLKQVLKGQHGGYYVIADVGTLEGLQQMGAHSKRIPDFIIPEECPLVQEAEGNTTTHDRERLRPDIMLVQVNDVERQNYTTKANMPALNTSMPDNTPRKAWIVEGGYCSDTR